MTHRDVELLAIGAGPSNLALAVALDELAPDDVAVESLVIEQAEAVAWQPGLLLPWTTTQVSFLKDLVTLRNPQSRFSFLNFLHSVGRLDAFINMASFTPLRLEISEYLRWVGESLSRVRLEFSRRCTAIEPRYNSSGTLTGWLTSLADGSTIGSRYLVIGAGRDINIPHPFTELPASRVIHSTRYVPRLAELAKDRPYRVAVVGAAQSAAEMFYAVQQDLPACTAVMLMRSIGLNAYEGSKFTNELYYPSFVDEFYGARPEAREQMLREMHRTNYAGLAPALLDALYRQMYLDRLTGKDRMRIVTMTDVTAAREEADEVVLDLVDRRTGATEELRCDLVLLGTGFVRDMPAMVRRLADELGLDRIEVSRHYRLRVPGAAEAACYLQGMNEATHGIADSLLSVLAHRSQEITADLLAHRTEHLAADLAADVAADVVAVSSPEPRSPVMDVRRLDRTTLKHENGLDAQRLLPWPALNAPFEGSWCVIAPGSASTPHAHHEHEIFIAVAGEAVLEAEGEQADFQAGDVVYFPPGVEHRVVNKGEAAFEMYSVWWDAQMSHRFVVRHHGEG